MLSFLLAAALSVSPAAHTAGPTAAPDTVLSPLTATAPQTADARPSAPVSERQPDIEISPRIAVTSLYSGDFGFGIGAGVRARSGATTATLDGRLSQYYQAASLTFDSHDPQKAHVFGRLRGVASSQSRWRYHGIGGTTDGADRVDLDLASGQVTAALGVRPLGTRAVTVQPQIGARIDRIDTLDPEAQIALDRLDVNSRQAFDESAFRTRRALSAGLTAELDTRDKVDYPTSGTLASVGARRVFGITGSDLRYNRYDVRLAGFVPLGQRVVLFGRASGSVARAADGEAIPIFYLPTLDPDRLAGYPVGRFRGRDTALFSVGARVPIIDALGTYGVDAVVTASAGNAYRDVFEEFSLGVTTRSNPEDDGIAVPLRPVLGIGLALVNIPKGRVALGGTLGLGPEGTTLFAFRLATGIGDDLPTLW